MLAYPNLQYSRLGQALFLLMQVTEPVVSSVHFLDKSSSLRHSSFDPFPLFFAGQEKAFLKFAIPEYFCLMKMHVHVPGLEKACIG